MSYDGPLLASENPTVEVDKLELFKKKKDSGPSKKTEGGGDGDDDED